MIEVQDFNERIIPKGSLVFIIHKNKPYKTGWYLKTSNYNNETEYGQEGVYILAKNVTNYDKDPKDKSRMEHGKFIIKSKSIRNSHYYDNHYEILSVVNGVESLVLQEDNYKLTSRIFGATTYLKSRNVEVTDRFLKLLNYIEEKEDEEKDLKELAEHIK